MSQHHKCHSKILGHFCPECNITNVTRLTLWKNDYSLCMVCHKQHNRLILCRIEIHSRNISVKVLSKYLQWLGSKCHFSIFPIISLWKLLSYHSNQTNELIFIKKTQTFNPPAQGCYRWYWGPFGPVASEEMSFENVDARQCQTYDRHTTDDDNQLPIL